MKQTDPQYKLRFPPKLKERIEEAAKASGRSMNAEIVSRLENSFGKVAPDQPFEATMQDYLEKFQALLEEAKKRD